MTVHISEISIKLTIPRTDIAHISSKSSQILEEIAIL